MLIVLFRLKVAIALGETAKSIVGKYNKIFISYSHFTPPNRNGVKNRLKEKSL